MRRGELHGTGRVHGVAKRDVFGVGRCFFLGVRRTLRYVSCALEARDFARTRILATRIHTRGSCLNTPENLDTARVCVDEKLHKARCASQGRLGRLHALSGCMESRATVEANLNVACLGRQ